LEAAPDSGRHVVADVAAAVRGEKQDEFGRDFTRKPMLKSPYWVSKIAARSRIRRAAWRSTPRCAC